MINRGGGKLSNKLILRRKAEELLRERPSKLDSINSESDILGLIHELEVSRIELEIQNQELLVAVGQAELAAAKYADLYDLAPVGYFTLSLESEIIKLNLTGAKMLGKERSKLKGCLFGFYVTDETKPLFNLFLDKVFTSLISENCDIMLSSNGDLPSYVHLNGILNEDGEHCLITMTDITQIKLTEQELISSKDRLSFLVNKMGAGVLLQGPKAEILMNNPEALQLLGLSEDQLLGLSSFSPEWNVIHEDGSPFPGHTHPVPQAIETKKAVIDVVMGVYRPETRDRVWLLVRAIPQLNSDGTVNQVVCTFTDITERKYAEDQLKSLSTRLTMAARASGIGVWEYDIVNNILVWDDQMFFLYGIDKNDFGGNYEVWRSALHPDDVARAEGSIQMAISGVKEYNIEFRVVWPDGSIHHLRALGSVERDDSGQALRIIGTNLDITKQKNTEQELINARQQAEESDRLKSAFLSNMSHEIRTPMNGILGFSELLKEPNLSGDEQKEYISLIEQSGARMLNIINDIIDISKIEAGQMPVNISESNINEQMDYIYTFFKSEATQKGLQLYLKKTLASKDSVIQTDREKLFAILTNLVKNAIKFTDKGSIVLGYEIVRDNARLVSTPMELQFFVKDTGIGIPKKRHEAIFKRFIQADIDDKRAFQGSGLGLTISKTYVEMLGGRIWVESEVGKGSVFYFTLPFKTKPLVKSFEEVTASYRDKVNLKNRLKILIVEDDEISEALISISVKPISKEILKVTTGVEAIETCRNNPDIDLVLMDIQLPVMNGYQATQEIRKFNPEVVIIAQTAYALTGEREKALAAGCTDYIAKPIDIPALKSLIIKFFDN